MIKCKVIKRNRSGLHEWEIIEGNLTVTCYARAARDALRIYSQMREEHSSMECSHKSGWSVDKFFSRMYLHRAAADAII
jgi:hypothetical protein